MDKSAILIVNKLTEIGDCDSIKIAVAIAFLNVVAGMK